LREALDFRPDKRPVQGQISHPSCEYSACKSFNNKILSVASRSDVYSITSPLHRKLGCHHVQ
jgi:hypothetical protein